MVRLLWDSTPIRLIKHCGVSFCGARRFSNFVIFYSESVIEASPLLRKESCLRPLYLHAYQSVSGETRATSLDEAAAEEGRETQEHRVSFQGYEMCPKQNLLELPSWTLERLARGLGHPTTL